MEKVKKDLHELIDSIDNLSILEYLLEFIRLKIKRK